MLADATPHHLIGDTSHGDGRHNRAFRMQGIHRMLLHARRLAFVHPHTGVRIEEMLELTQMDLVDYQHSGGTAILLHVNPSKIDQERILVVPHTRCAMASATVKGEVTGPPTSIRWPEWLAP